MAIYFIDFENVKSDGFVGIENLKATDVIDVFYSVNAQSISFDAHKRISESEAAFEYHDVATGKNSLDFQLATYLGYKVRELDGETFYIVSNDMGFDNVVKFWKNKGIKIKRVANLQGKNKEEHEREIMDSLIALIPQYKDDAQVIQKYIEQYKTKQGFNNALVKKFKSEKAGEIYKAVKPLIANKKGK